jgi:hypothetical protein
MIIELPIAAAELDTGSFGVSRGANGADATGVAFCLGGSPWMGRLPGVGGVTSSRLLNMTSPVGSFFVERDLSSLRANRDQLWFYKTFTCRGGR